MDAAQPPRPEGGLVQAPPEPTPRSPLAHRRIPSTELFRGAVELEILHREQIYRLRQTALGKLILTK